MKHLLLGAAIGVVLVALLVIYARSLREHRAEFSRPAIHAIQLFLWPTPNGALAALKPQSDKPAPSASSTRRS